MVLGSCTVSKMVELKGVSPKEAVSVAQASSIHNV